MSLLNPNSSKFCSLHMPEGPKLIFCIWNKWTQKLWPVNLLVGFIFFFIASQRPENSSTVAFIHILWQNSQNQWVKEDSWVLSQEILSLDWTLGTQIGWTNEMRFYLQPTSYSLSHSGIWLTMTLQSFRKMSQVMVFRGLNNFIHRVSRQLWPGKGAIRSFFTKI